MDFEISLDGVSYLVDFKHPQSLEARANVGLRYTRGCPERWPRPLSLWLKFIDYKGLHTPSILQVKRCALNWSAIFNPP